MPLYDFACEQGHVTEKYFGMNDVKSAECSTCGGPTRRIFSRAAVVDDFPEHYNVSMGCVVKNRKHHRALQKELGCHDYEPCNDSPGSRLTEERTRREGRKIFT